MKCGLLGKKLGHSYSPQIHALLEDYEYLLYEKTEDELEDFVRHGAYTGLNVTIPYKKSVIPFCDILSETAKATGSVNTLIKDSNGRITGDNTDVYGFTALVRKSGIDPTGKKTLVLGNGGAAASVCYALKTMGAIPVVISRRGEDNYSNLARHKDAELIVNTTPVGMYPDNGKAALSLEGFPECKGVLDIIYNPARTALLLEAEEKGISCADGLYMLVAQAKRSSELFTGSVIPDAKIDEIMAALEAEMRNIVLIGMPGCGKTTIARILSEQTGREAVDTDQMIVDRAGMSIPRIMSKYGEQHFRDLESEAIAEAGKRSGIIIATGGGCILREQNRRNLRQNSRVFWIRRDISLLPTHGRPLSQSGNLNEMYGKRKPFYEKTADYCIDNDNTFKEAADEILRVLS